MWSAIAQQISQATGTPFQPETQRSVGGGCINQAYALTDGAQTYFVKLNQASQLPMFEAEALGLREMFESQTIRVPKPICWGVEDTVARASAYIVMEWLDLGGGKSQSWQIMGQHLAAMHRVTSTKGFGWDRSNTIGSTPQPNPWTESWIEFFTTQRIQFQLNLANHRGGHFPREQELLNAIPSLLSGHEVQPALVHGDLWSGNAAVMTDDTPVILDPATYYGDREVDLAMTELFGGFPSEFYRAYEQAYPLDSGYSQRKTLYNLYHILNHFNLFGGGYGSQANRMMDQLLS